MTEIFKILSKGFHLSSMTIADEVGAFLKYIMRKVETN